MNVAEWPEQLKSLTSMIRKSKAINVNSEAVKEAAIATGSSYFKEYRGEAATIIGDETKLIDMDRDCQQLIRLAHGNNSKKSYLSILSRLSKNATNLAISAHASISPQDHVIQASRAISQAERILIETLDKLLLSAAQSYRQGMQDLSGEERYSYKGTACEFREALRETLDLLAPDNDVKSQSWFKLEPNCTGPTMRQKVRFILGSRGKTKAQQESTGKSIDLIESLCGDVARAVYNRASLSTHLQTTKQEVSRMKRYLDAVLFDILEIRPK